MKSCSKNRGKGRRTGAILPLFGFLLPVIFLMCGLAINVAHMRLTKTEMKIAVDAAAHGGGRSMSINQTTDDAMATAKLVASWNSVNGSSLIVPDEQIEFCSTTRAQNGFGRYQFQTVTKKAVDDGEAFATSMRVWGNRDIPLLVRAIPGVSTYETNVFSTATQVDRDIALVLDRSGSMLYYQNEEALEQQLEDLLNNVTLVANFSWQEEEYEVEVDIWTKLEPWKNAGKVRTSPPKPANAHKWQKGTRMETRTRDVWREDGTFTTVADPLITEDEYDDATEYLYDRTYSQNVVEQLAAVNVQMGEYTADWRANNSGNTGTAPRHSRWDLLAQGVEAFLTVLERTDQEEQVSLVTFNNNSQQDTVLVKTFSSIRIKMATIKPYGGTAIHKGLEQGLPPILNDPSARTFASKTIVVLTDGQNNDSSVDLGKTVGDLIDGKNVTVHAMTFTEGAAQAPMQAVATAGHGRHYHAANGDKLIEDFEEIANNLPTILTE
jgi:hypothetical protein